MDKKLIETTVNGKFTIEGDLYESGKIKLTAFRFINNDCKVLFDDLTIDTTVKSSTNEVYLDTSGKRNIVIEKLISLGAISKTKKSYKEGRKMYKLYRLEKELACYFCNITNEDAIEVLGY